MLMSKTNYKSHQRLKLETKAKSIVSLVHSILAVQFLQLTQNHHCRHLHLAKVLCTFLNRNLVSMTLLTEIKYQYSYYTCSYLYVLSDIPEISNLLGCTRMMINTVMTLYNTPLTRKLIYYTLIYGNITIRL